MTEKYIPTDPLALQSAQVVKVRPKYLPDVGVYPKATVRLVDALNRYVTVSFEGTTTPVALPAGEWCFERLEVVPAAPQIDGLYAKEDEVEAGDDPTALFRRKDGEWTNLMAADPTVKIPEVEIPPVLPLRAHSTAPASASTPTPPATGTIGTINQGDPA